MILRREISWGVSDSGGVAWTEVEGGGVEVAGGGVVPLSGELESLGMRKSGRPGVALRRGMVSGEAIALV